jgi:hypothetical protein
MILRRKKMKKDTEELLNAVEDIAEIIYMELPLRYQDQWLENIMAKGMWKPEETEEILREQEQ